MRSLPLCILALAMPAFAAPGSSRVPRDRKPMQVEEPDRAEREAPVQVVMATRPVAPGAVIDAGDLTLEAVPARLAPPHPLTGIDAVAGRVAVERLLPGEPVRAERLASAEAGTHWTAALARGHRAVHLTVSGPLTEVVQPGDRIDLLAAPPDAGAACLALGRAPVLRRAADGGLWVAAPAADAARLASTGDHALTLAFPDPAGVPDTTPCTGGAR